MTTINPLLTSTPTLPHSASKTEVASQEVFQSLLSLLLTSTAPSGAMEQNMLSPIMSVLLEKLVEIQVRNSSVENVVSSSSPITSTENASIGQLVPDGLPVQGGYLTQGYHKGHNGLDFGVVVGTPVQSTMDGTVIYSGWNNQGYGNLVIVEFGPYRTYYAHLSETPLKVGQQVRKGDVVALSGNTGNSTGPHLHYEIRYNRQAIDPSTSTL